MYKEPAICKVCGNKLQAEELIKLQELSPDRVCYFKCNRENGFTWYKPQRLYKEVE